MNVSWRLFYPRFRPSSFSLDRQASTASANQVQPAFHAAWRTFSTCRVPTHGDTFLPARTAKPGADRSHDRKGVFSSDAPNGQVRLSIQDDGRGLDAAGSNGRGMGMIGMRARARSSGGDVEVRAAPGGGVLIEVRVPLRNETHSHPVA
jgi:hypothetical protein